MSRAFAFAIVLTTTAALPARAAEAPALRGSPGSMVRQHEVAVANDYSFLRDGAEVRRFAENGYLVRVDGSDDLELANVSFAYARPVVATFVLRLAGQYRAGCGERLVVTSLTRPLTEQPSNAHALSVHPAGMAVDLRVSSKAACRGWLESTLLSLERRGLLDVTRESRPPHYHVAVFPDAYAAYVARVGGAGPDDTESTARKASSAPAPVADPAPAPRAAAMLSSTPDPFAGDEGGAAWATLLGLGVLTTVGALAAAGSRATR
ncbi:MAG TPA: DUF5715 family protein [Longimicrobiaceae bacterium]|nr:DUF5715 family protein [Longimicrobiaceae bacterium]